MCEINLSFWKNRVIFWRTQIVQLWCISRNLDNLEFFQPLCFSLIFSPFVFFKGFVSCSFACVLNCDFLFSVGLRRPFVGGGSWCPVQLPKTSTPTNSQEYLSSSNNDQGSKPTTRADCCWRIVSWCKFHFFGNILLSLLGQKMSKTTQGSHRKISTPNSITEKF